MALATIFARLLSRGLPSSMVFLKDLKISLGSLSCITCQLKTFEANISGMFIKDFLSLDSFGLYDRKIIG